VLETYLKQGYEILPRPNRRATVLKMQFFADSVTYEPNRGTIVCPQHLHNPNCAPAQQFQKHALISSVFYTLFFTNLSPHHAFPTFNIPVSAFDVNFRQNFNHLLDGLKLPRTTSARGDQPFIAISPANYSLFTINPHLQLFRYYDIQDKAQIEHQPTSYSPTSTTAQSLLSHFQSLSTPTPQQILSALSEGHAMDRVELQLLLQQHIASLSDQFITFPCTPELGVQTPQGFLLEQFIQQIINQIAEKNRNNKN
jgi:hypothetical protein